MSQRQDGNLGLTENFSYDSDNRLLSSTLASGSTQTTNLQISYNPDGSMQQKMEAGGTDAAVAYSVPQWTSYNYPQTIAATVNSSETESATFDYGPDRRRWRMVYVEGSASETTEYIGGLMEKVTSSSGSDYRYYVDGANGLAAIVSVDGSTVTPHYVLEDPEGSIASLLNSTGSVAANESFTAYGNRREASTWSGPASSTEEAVMDGITRQGFTGQTVLAQMGLNHMNGRVEDAVTGTFLSPDPYVTDPYNTQDYNRYAYVYNNPLSAVDPSGFGVQYFCPDLDQGGGAPVTADSSSEAGYISTDNVDQDCEPVLPQITITPPQAPPPDPSPPPSLPPLILDDPYPAGLSVPGGPGFLPTNSVSTGAQQQSNPCAGEGKAPPPQYFQQAGQELQQQQQLLQQQQNIGGAPWVNGLAAQSWTLGTLSQFARGGSLDAQAYNGPSCGRDPACVGYGNYAFGVFMSAAGYSLQETLSGANAYGALRSSYGPTVPMDTPSYPSIPAANAQNITAGYNAQQGGQLCHP